MLAFALALVLMFVVLALALALAHDAGACAEVLDDSARTGGKFGALGCVYGSLGPALGRRCYYHTPEGAAIMLTTGFTALCNADLTALLEALQMLDGDVCVARCRCFLFLLSSTGNRVEPPCSDDATPASSLLRSWYGIRCY